VKMKSRTVALAVTAGALGLGLGVAALNASSGSALTAVQSAEVQLMTPSGPASLSVGSLDARSLKYAGTTPSANVFTAVDGETGYTCLVVAPKAAGAATAGGCDPLPLASARGQFIRYTAGDGTTMGAYRTFKTIRSASVGGSLVVPVAGVVPFEIGPNSKVTVDVETTQGTESSVVQTGGSLDRGPAAAQ
jgi:hypothetical protein